VCACDESWLLCPRHKQEKLRPDTRNRKKFFTKYREQIGKFWDSHVPVTFQLTAIWPFLAFLASRIFNKLRVFNTPLIFDSPRLHEIVLFLQFLNGTVLY